jgi:hypothetical protein
VPMYLYSIYSHIKGRPPARRADILDHFTFCARAPQQRTACPSSQSLLSDTTQIDIRNRAKPQLPLSTGGLVGHTIRKVHMQTRT